MNEFNEYVKMEIGTGKSIGPYWATRVPGGLMLTQEQERGYSDSKRYFMTDTFVPFSGTLRQTLEQL